MVPGRTWVVGVDERPHAANRAAGDKAAAGNMPGMMGGRRSDCASAADASSSGSEGIPRPWTCVAAPSGSPADTAAGPGSVEEEGMMRMWRPISMGRLPNVAPD